MPRNSPAGGDRIFFVLSQTHFFPILASCFSSLSTHLLTNTKGHAHIRRMYTHTQTNFVALIARSFRFLIYSTTHFIVYVPRGRSLRVLLLKFGCFCCHSTLEHQGTGRTLFSFLGLSSLCSSGAPPLPKSAHHHLLSITSTGRVVWWCACCCCCYSVTQGFFLSLRGAGSSRSAAHSTLPAHFAADSGHSRPLLTRF